MTVQLTDRTFGDMVDEVRITSSEPNSVFNKNRIKLSIIASVNKHLGSIPNSNREEFSFLTRKGVEQYDILADIHPEFDRFLDEVIYIDIDQDKDNRYQCFVKSYRFVRNQSVGVSHLTYPEFVCIVGDKVLFWPIPDGVHRVHGRCSLNYAAPVSYLDTSGVRQYSPDNFTNAWFSIPENYQMILQYSLYILYSRYLKDTVSAQESLALYAQLNTVVDDIAEHREGADLTQTEPYPVFI